MWENEERKNRIRNIVVSLLLIAATAGLLFAMLTVIKQTADEEIILKEASSNQRQKLNDAYRENLEAINDAYKQDMEVVNTYLPGIVCWGDSLTAGSFGNISYPSTLQKYLDAHLCDIYDFHSTIEDALDYSRLEWEDYTVSIPVVNLGSGEENTATILGRSGVVPYVVADGFEIPAEAEGVSITIRSENGETVTPLTAGNAGVNPVTIAGVEGIIARTTEGEATYLFTRTEAGESVSVEKGEKIVTASENQYQNYLHIVWMGTYGDYTSPEKLVSDTKALLTHQVGNNDRYLVLGPCTVRGKWNNTPSNDMDAIDSAMLQAFGNHYVNIRKYLLEDGIADGNLELSEEDIQLVQSGIVPTGFRSNASGADLNAAAYKLIGKLVYERMDNLGYFDEIRDELGLNKTTQEILKTDPMYFEYILNAK